MEGEAGETERNTSENRDSTGLRQQDRLLPIANVSRIMKKVLPGSVKVSKDAKEMLQECVSEFISFITGESSEKCQKEKRKTINGDDLLWAMTTLGFEDYFEPLQLYLQKYREVEEEKTLTERQGEGAGAGAGAGEMGGSLVNWASTGGGSDGTGEIHDMLKSNGVMMRHVDERGK